MSAKQIDQLVKMAHQIALNLGAGHADDAPAKTAAHLSRFWTVAMRRQLIDYWRAGGAVEPVVAESLAALESTDTQGSETK